MGMWKHIYWLYLFYRIKRIQQCQIPGLRGRVTAYIYNFGGRNFQQLVYQFFVHACPWGICNDDVGLPMMGKKRIIAYIHYIASKKFCIIYIIAGCILFCIVYCLFDEFNTHHFARVAGHKNADAAGAAIKIIYNFSAG